MTRENKIKKEGENYTMSIETAKFIKFGDSESYQRFVSDAIGKYFEYCVYKQFITQATKCGATVSSQADSTFLKQQAKSAKLLPEEISEIEAAAAEAVSIYLKDTVNRLEVTAIAGSNSVGDFEISINGLAPILLELKFYSQGRDIKYFQLSDAKNFGDKEKFVKVISEMTQPKLWYTASPVDENGNPIEKLVTKKSGKIIGVERWVDLVRSKGLERYVQSMQGNQNDKAFLLYILQKGTNQFQTHTKDLIVGHSISADGSRISAQFDLSGILNRYDNSEFSHAMKEVSYQFLLNNQPIASLTTEKSQIRDRSYQAKKGVNKWAATTIYCYLKPKFLGL